MKRPGYSAADLATIEEALGWLLAAEGIPRSSVSEISVASAMCESHRDSVVVHLRLPEGARVRVRHCGCDNWLAPVAAPPADLAELAHGLAGEIAWYWRSRAGILAHVAEIGEACEREAGRASSMGLESRFVEARPAPFDTFRGRRQHTDAYFDLIHDNLFPARWWRPFWSVNDATQFFRSIRPYQRALVEKRDELAVAGAKGAIDSVAVAAIRKAGMDPLEIIAELSQCADHRRIDVGGTELLLFWRMMTIRCKIDLAPGVRWEFGDVRFTMSLEHSLRRLRHGPIGEMVSSPLMPGDAIVKSARRDFTETVLTVEPRCQLFDLRDGVATWIGDPRALADAQD